MQNASGIHYQKPFQKAQDFSYIEVGLAHESSLEQEVKRFLDINVGELWSSKTYLMLHDSADLVGLDTQKPFLDPVQSRCSLNQDLIAQHYNQFEFAQLIIATLQPGTSDAEGNVALEQALIAKGLKPSKHCAGYLAKTYFVKNDLSAGELKKLSEFLFNPELYSTHIFSKAEYTKGIDLPLPLVSLENQIEVEKISLDPEDTPGLLELNKTKKLAASLEEMQQFAMQYQRPDYIAKRKELGLNEQATDVEIETWFGLRSEHCFHKEFNARIELEVAEEDAVFAMAREKGWLKQEDGKLVLEDGMFKTFIRVPAVKIYEDLEARGKNWIASMFSDNSGVVYYDQDYMYCLKVETHNSPSNIEPVQGAKTGLNGNFRDIMGTMRGSFDILMGFFCYCTGDPNQTDWLPPGVKHPYRLLTGMTKGIREAGNEMQIPTLGGLVCADPRYIAKCLVYAGAVGWSPVQSDTCDYRTKNPAVGDRVFVAGQPVGIDGIHGATESSLSASKDISLGHVQADFSFIQVKVKEFLLAASRAGLFTAVTDFGAMGLGSASHEMARSTGGLEMDLAKHPVKYQGIQPWQINCSETQDRMLLVAHPDKTSELQELAEYYGVELSDLGSLNDSGYIQLKFNDDTVGLFDIKQLFSSEPRKLMKGSWQEQERNVSKINDDLSLQEKVERVLSHPDVASRAWFFRQKDFSVKGSTVIGPLYGQGLKVDSDVGLQKPLDTVGRDSGAIAYAQALAPKVSDVDPYLAVQKSYLDMLAKIVALGGSLPDLTKASWDAWAVCGNYCQPNSDSETTLLAETGAENLSALVREGIAIRELIEHFNIPIISGKDSMKCSAVYNLPADYDLDSMPAYLKEHASVKKLESGETGVEIHDPATYLISAAVKIDDYEKCQTADFKVAGDAVYLISKPLPGLDASIFSHIVSEDLPAVYGDLRPVNLDQFEQTAKIISSVVQQGLTASSAAVHIGGLMTALVKSCLAGGLGVEIDLSQLEKDQSDLNQILFSEQPGRYLLSVAPEMEEKFLLELSDIDCYRIGSVTESGFQIKSSAGDNPIDLLKAEEAYQKTYNFGGL